jgi:serine phosphatase RsbU (regulator of sigma subunit)
MKSYMINSANIGLKISGYTLLFVVMLFLACPVLGQPTNKKQLLQDNKIERLRLLYKSTKSDTSRVKILNQLYKELISSEPLQAKKYAEEALNISEKLKYYLGIAKSSDNVGNVYYDQGAYVQALEYYQKSLKFKEKLGNKIQVSKAYNKLANTYVRKGDRNAGKEYYEKSLRLSRDIGYNKGVITTLTNLGSYYNSVTNYEKALEYHLQAIQVEGLDDKKVLAYNYNRIGDLYLRKSDYSLALRYYRQELLVARADGDDVEMQKAYRGISEVYAKRNDYQKAYEYYQLFAQTKELINQRKSKEKIKEIQSLFDAQKKQNLTEILLLTQNQKIKDDRIAQRNKLLWVVVFAFVAVLTLAFFFYRNNVRTQRINHLLEKKSKELEENSTELKKQIQQNLAKEEAINRQKRTLEQALDEIERKNKNITASINYAKRIQESMLPFSEQITRHLPEHFIFFKPRDIVSGDFYYFTTKNGKIIIAEVDCTGHGVPGAIMSMLGNDYLNQIINLQGITSPDRVLNELHKNIRTTLKQDETENRDGMDIALIVIDPATRTLEFAGASSPLTLIQNGEMDILLSSELPIGGFQKDKERVFTKHTVSFDQPTTFYVFSDGFQDQFGGPRGRRFAKKKLRKLLFEIHEKPMVEQKKILDNTLKDWMYDPKHKREHKQIDDILVIGVHLS